ncbi:unnamed protein product [Rotaria sp. Silwood2]|nr:unnamed protein product [Rotaria sp. Silwood2]
MENSTNSIEDSFLENLFPNGYYSSFNNDVHYGRTLYSDYNNSSNLFSPLSSVNNDGMYLETKDSSTPSELPLFLPGLSLKSFKNQL